MSLLELFRNYAPKQADSEKVTVGNSCNLETVTYASHATQGGNRGNSGNSGNVTFSKEIENTQQQATATAPPATPATSATLEVEVAATTAIRVYHYRVTDKPNSELTVITHGKELSEVREGLLLRYCARLIIVYPMVLDNHPTIH